MTDKNKVAIAFLKLKNQKIIRLERNSVNQKELKKAWLMFCLILQVEQ